ncbi:MULTISPECIES: hypothetical protein [Gammaproteobacteria]|uniref:hypothetical protein n=1 Tax=Gammaproteobacteria TaxID=1236 RepID=UPI000DD0B43C|nr:MULTISPECIES: hypothetical protein [Gammaproteobacteria]RTE86875.1 hypothetical protein DQX04_00325 [Aliidiomarina sp. B3213]TCZ93336.1 hypothetical protein EYQ95_04975 [Lysobacter sp. N42]
MNNCKHTLLVVLLCLICAFEAYAEDDEEKESYLRTPEEQRQLLTEHAVFPEEGRQHQQLALSLRNQRLLEAQAESRARQLQFQLQAAQALHAIRQLSVVVDSSELQTSDESNNEVSYQTDLKRFRLLGIWRRSNGVRAKLAYGEHLFTVKHGDRLLGNIVVHVNTHKVVLNIDGKRHELSMGGF